MNTTTVKSLNALMKTIKQEQEKGVSQFAVIIHETVKDGEKVRVYEYSRPFVDGDEG